MRDHPQACKKLLKILLHIQIEKIQIIEEETILSDKKAKGIRLDLYIKNETHIFDVELQIKNTNELPERARYYQGLMDVDNLKISQHYSELKTSYVIFICINDIFGKGLPAYHFKNLCMEDPNIKMNDRAYKVFFIASHCDKIIKDCKQKAIETARNFINMNFPLKQIAQGTGLTLEQVQEIKDKDTILFS